MQTLVLDNLKIISYSDQITTISNGYLINGAKVSLEFNQPTRGYYRHGWQSWSLTTWQDPTFRLPVQKPAILHPLQTDPLYVRHPAPNGSWLGAVRFVDEKVLLLGALGLDSHVALHDKQLHGWYETDSGSEWFVGFGKEADVFALYAKLLGERLGTAPGKSNPRVWCSWYSLYTAIDESLLYRVFDELDDLPFDVLQVDDGWQKAVGDWEPNKNFPSGMVALADKIRASGRTPGLWLAPLIAGHTSALFRHHPECFLKDADGNFVSAGFNWGEQLYALDTSHPKALEWLAALMKQVRARGFDYLKLDFLYAGALPGKRHVDMPRETAYRQSLKVMREAMGADAYFLASGAPILPSIGLCDALRIGPDVAGEWESHRDVALLYNPTTPGTKNAIRTTINRLWLSPLVATDPDVAYFRSQNISMNAEQKKMLQDLAQVCNFKATSDLPQWLSTNEREELRAFLETESEVQPMGGYTFRLDARKVNFSPAMPLPNIPTGLNALFSSILGWLGNQPWVLAILYKIGKQSLENTKKSL